MIRQNFLAIVDTMFHMVWILAVVIRTGELAVHLEKVWCVYMRPGRNLEVNIVVGFLYVYISSRYLFLFLVVIRVAWATSWVSQSSSSGF